MNALKTGLFAESEVLPSEDPAEYQDLIARYYADHKPANCPGVPVPGRHHLLHLEPSPPSPRRNANSMTSSTRIALSPMTIFRSARSAPRIPRSSPNSSGAWTPTAAPSTAPQVPPRSPGRRTRSRVRPRSRTRARNRNNPGRFTRNWLRSEYPTGSYPAPRRPGPVARPEITRNRLRSEYRFPDHPGPDHSGPDHPGPDRPRRPPGI